jgi:transcriptional regulator with XRE-family HTH domain
LVPESAIEGAGYGVLRGAGVLIQGFRGTPLVQSSGSKRRSNQLESEIAPDRAGASPDRKSRANPGDARNDYKIGPKLKHARLLKGLTLLELAETVGCSESMLSKLENQKLSPSISFLHRLASALGTSIAELFSESSHLSGPVHHFPADRCLRIADAGHEGAWFERIIPIAKSGLLQANILNIPPGVRSDADIQHIGEELGYLIEGELEVTVDGRSYMMKSGDLLFFSSSLPHGYKNTGDTVARILWVNTPPSL